MNWLARLKKAEAAHQPDAANVTDPGLAAAIPARIQQPELPSPLVISQSSRYKAGSLGDRAARELAYWSDDQRRIAYRSYHAHHFNCRLCIAAGRGSQYGQRCDEGLELLATCDTPRDEDCTAESAYHQPLGATNESATLL